MQLKEFSSLYWRIEISLCALSIPSATVSSSMSHNELSNFLEASTDVITSFQSMVLIAFTYSFDTSLFGIDTSSFRLSYVRYPRWTRSVSTSSFCCKSCHVITEVPVLILTLPPASISTTESFRPSIFI